MQLIRNLRFPDARQRLIDSGAFDAGWYRRSYPDVAIGGFDPARHYLRYGHRLGRDPGPEFSADFIRTIFHMNAHEEPVSGLRRHLAAGKTPDPDLILMAAAALAEDGRDDLAITLAERWLPPALSYSAQLLRANAALRQGNRPGWLDHLNTYLAAQDVAPMMLADGDTLFDRLSSPPLPPMPDGPLVSVLMAAWNAEATVAMAVRSVLNQSWRNLELLVVDDASTDHTWPILNRLAQDDPRLRIWRNPINAGPYLSRNVALSQARGQWITGHDADDWAHPERIARQVGFCRQHQQPACLSGMLRMTDEGEFVRFNPIGGNVIDGACRNAFISLMVDAQLLHSALGHWDEVRVAGDSELLHRLQAVTGKRVQTLPKVTMLCLDNPAGLTNHARLGHSESGGVSPHRRAYKKAFTKFHSKIGAETARLEFPAAMRRFPAATEILNAAQTATTLMQAYAARGFGLRRQVDADIAIVTSMAFQGGNGASTMEEVEFFRALGLNVALIHCPTRRDIAQPVSARYDGVGHLVTNWTRLESLRAKALILRHPVVASAPAFARIAERLHADQAFVVVNNSRWLADGRAAYDIDRMIALARQIDSPDLRFCPISGTIRQELLDHDPTMPLSSGDWLPTLDSAQYLMAPKPRMIAPYRIGRHGRDGVEKWPEDRAVLQSAYPGDADMQVVILGGARNAAKILGRKPTEWTIHAFGDMSPRDYLADLDAFVYFPHSGLIEAFGRAIAEAMLAGVPCILSPRFQPTFGDCGLYCEPAQVAALVRLLAQDDAGRQAYLAEVQRIAAMRHAPQQIAARIAATGLLAAPPIADQTPALAPAIRAWRADLLARLQSSS